MQLRQELGADRSIALLLSADLFCMVAEGSELQQWADDREWTKLHDQL